ncbi:50S ribosomal protein L23, chloroplastic [Linum grandiflorum]
MQILTSASANGFVPRISSPTAFKFETKTTNLVEFHGSTERKTRFSSLSTHAKSINNLDQYECISRPLASEAAMKNVIDNNTLVFTVDVGADKKMIKAAMKNVFNVEARKVNTLIRPDKRKKKAFVMLKPEYNAVDVAKRLGIL